MDAKHLATASAATDPNVKLLIPPPGTIARKLIDGWLHAPVATHPRLLGCATTAALVTQLKSQQQTISFCESSSGGLCQASVLAVPGASAVYIGGSVIYSSGSPAGRLILDDEAAAEIQRVKDYSSAEAYVASKHHSSACSAKALRKELGTTWALAEAGATGPGFKQGIKEGFTALSLAGPKDDSDVATIVVKTGHNDREANMWQFRDAAISMLTRHIAEKS